MDLIVLTLHVWGFWVETTCPRLSLTRIFLTTTLISLGNFRRYLLYSKPKAIRNGFRDILKCIGAKRLSWLVQVCNLFFHVSVYSFQCFVKGRGRRLLTKHCPTRCLITSLSSLRLTMAFFGKSSNLTSYDRRFVTNEGNLEINDRSQPGPFRDSDSFNNPRSLALNCEYTSISLHLNLFLKFVKMCQCFRFLTIEGRISDLIGYQPLPGPILTQSLLGITTCWIAAEHALQHARKNMSSLNPTINPVKYAHFYLPWHPISGMTIMILPLQPASDSVDSKVCAYQSNYFRVVSKKTWGHRSTACELPQEHY